MGSSVGHELGDEEITPTIDGHAHSLSSDFLSKARTAAAGPVRMLAFMRSVGRFNGGQDLSLLPVTDNASLLLMPTASARSFHEGHLEVVMRLHYHDRYVLCYVS